MRFYDDNFSKYLQKSLNDLRMCEKSHDVTIVVDGKEFAAHKAVLAALSPYFRAMFNTQWNFRESKEDKITLHGVDSDALAAILNFIYTSDVEITEKNVYPLLETSDLLQIYALRVWIYHFLQTTISIDNCLSLYEIANLHEYYDLAESSWHYILLNFSQVAEGDEFLQMPVQIFIEILSSKLLSVTDESSLLEYVLKWVRSDAQNRKIHIEDLLNKIELQNVPVQTLVNLKDDPLFGSSISHRLDISICEHFNKRFQSKWKHCSDEWEKLRYSGEQGVIIAIGGESNGMASRNVECFTMGYDSWKCVIPQYVKSGCEPQNMNVIPAMRCGRYNAAVAHDLYNVHVLGGRNSSSLLDECETYDVRKNRWKSLRNLPCKLEGSGAVILDGKLIIIGGRNEFGSVDQSWEWDKRYRVWKKFPSLSTPRSFHGAIVVAGYIYVLGGFEKDSENAVRTAERYDPHLKQWCEIRCMHECRARFGCTVIDNYIYVIGGINGDCGLKTVERYNLETNEWSYMTSMPLPRHSFSVTVCNKKIYCIGGSDTIHYLSIVEKFNPYTNRWHYFHSLQLSRFGVVSATLFIPLIKTNVANCS